MLGDYTSLNRNNWTFVTCEFNLNFNLNFKEQSGGIFTNMLNPTDFLILSHLFQASTQ